jgi:hypothetical protein
MLKHFGVTEQNWQEDKNLLEPESPCSWEARSWPSRKIQRVWKGPDTSLAPGHKSCFTDVDGRRPDWGKLDVDCSHLPGSSVEDDKGPTSSDDIAEATVEANGVMLCVLPS